MHTATQQSPATTRLSRARRRPRRFGSVVACRLTALGRTLLAAFLVLTLLAVSVGSASAHASCPDSGAGAHCCEAVAPVACQDPCAAPAPPTSPESPAPADTHDSAPSRPHCPSCKCSCHAGFSVPAPQAHAVAIQILSYVSPTFDPARRCDEPTREIFQPPKLRA